MCPHIKIPWNILRASSLALLSFLLLTAAGRTQPSSDKAPSFQVADLQIEVDPQFATTGFSPTSGK